MVHIIYILSTTVIECDTRSPPICIIFVFSGLIQRWTSAASISRLVVISCKTALVSASLCHRQSQDQLVVLASPLYTVVCSIYGFLQDEVYYQEE